MDQHTSLDFQSILKEECKAEGVLADLLRESRQFKLPVFDASTLATPPTNKYSQINLNKHKQLNYFGQLLVKLCEEHRIDKVFDVGCGLGHLLGWLAENSNLKLVGIDYNADFCQKGSNLYSRF